jgi:hypothetical protein
MVQPKKEEGTIYGWAFVAGQKILEKLESLYDAERAEKRMENLLLTLRSELIPERFKRAIVDSIIEVNPEVGIPEEVKVERRWSVDEFYRYSTAILAGFFDSLNKWREEKEKKKERKEVNTDA